MFQPTFFLWFQNFEISNTLFNAHILLSVIKLFDIMGSLNNQKKK